MAGFENRDFQSFVSISIIGFAGYLTTLAEFPLKLWDEGYYALIARYMTEEEFWLIPHVFRVRGGVVPWFQKPPFWIWLEGASMRLLGPTTFAARLPTALITIATAGLVYLVARRFYNRRAALPSALIFLSLPVIHLPGHSGRSASLDLPLMFFGFAFLYLASEYPTSRRWLSIAGVCAGLAVMTKSVAAGVFAVALFAHIAGAWRTYLNSAPLYGVATGLAVMVPWPLYAYTKYPTQFLDEFILRQIARSSGGLNTYGDPIIPTANYPYLQLFVSNSKYITLGILLAGALTVLLVVQRHFHERDMTLLWWLGVVFLFFTLTGGNHPWYLAPMAFPAAILAGRAVSLIIKIYNEFIGTASPLQLSWRPYLLIGLIVTSGIFLIMPSTHGDTGQHDAAVALQEAAGNEPVYIQHNISRRQYVTTFYLRHEPKVARLTEIDNSTHIEYALLNADERENLNRSHTVLYQGRRLAAVQFTSD